MADDKAPYGNGHHGLDCPRRQHGKASAPDQRASSTTCANDVEAGNLAPDRVEFAELTC